MKKRFIVRFTFVGDFEEENDSDALRSAALSVRFGVENARHLKLEVVAAQPLQTANEVPAPVQIEDKQDAAQSAPSTDFPF